MPAYLGIDVGKQWLDYALLDHQGLQARPERIAIDELAALLTVTKPGAIAIDAPSGWAAAGERSRSGERALAQLGIRCYATPTEERAHGNAFYDWVRSGHRAYAQCVAAGFTIDGDARPVVETFPHATTLALLGGPYPTRPPAAKRTARAEALRVAGITAGTDWSQDAIDAVLAALVARSVAHGKARFVGELGARIAMLPDQP